MKIFLLNEYKVGSDFVYEILNLICSFISNLYLNYVHFSLLKINNYFHQLYDIINHNRSLFRIMHLLLFPLEYNKIKHYY